MVSDTFAGQAAAEPALRRRSVQNVRIYIFKDNYEVTMWWEEGSFSSSLEPDVRVIDKNIVPYSKATEWELAFMCDKDIKNAMRQEHLRKEFLKAKRAGRLHEIPCPN